MLRSVPLVASVVVARWFVRCWVPSTEAQLIGSVAFIQPGKVDKLNIGAGFCGTDQC